MVEAYAGRLYTKTRTGRWVRKAYACLAELGLVPCSGMAGRPLSRGSFVLVLTFLRPYFVCGAEGVVGVMELVNDARDI